MSPVETLLADVLRAHRYMATNQASQTGCHGCHWTFRVGQTERGRRAHEAHVAAEQAKALQAWLLSDETFEFARTPSSTGPCPPTSDSVPHEPTPKPSSRTSLT
jgi:hypothetical protein